MPISAQDERALAVLLQRVGGEPNQVIEQRRQREAQLELAPAPVVLLGQLRGERGRRLQIPDRLAGGEALAGAVRGDGEEAERARWIAQCGVTIRSRPATSSLDAASVAFTERARHVFLASRPSAIR